MKIQNYLLSFALIGNLTSNAQTTNCSPSVAAHRGFSAFYPENTLPAFNACIDIGADYVEGDIQFTLDGELVMLHDETVDRTTDGSGPVASFTLAQLKELDAGFPDKFGDQFEGTRIPTLEEALDLCKSRNALFCFELKAPGVAKQTADLIREKGMAGQGIVQSFLPQELAIMKAYAPEIPCLLLSFSSGFDQYIDYAAQIGIEYYSPGGIPEQAEIDYAHNKGIKYWVYTVDDPEDMRSLMLLNADGMFTNRPDILEGMSKPLISRRHDTLFANFSDSSINWMYNGADIIGATGPTQKLKPYGTYSYRAVNKLGCTYRSPDYVYSKTTGVSEEEIAESRLYLDESESMLYIIPAKSASEKATLRMVDITGRLVLEHVLFLNAIPQSIAIPELSAGVYVLSLLSGTEKTSIRIVK